MSVILGRAEENKKCEIEDKRVGGSTLSQVNGTMGF